jgi:hypothetical protein
MSSFCNLPISTGFDAHAATSCVSLDWVINSGLRTHNSQVSGVLTLPSDVGVISMSLNNMSVAACLTSDLVLGLDWFNHCTSLGQELVVYLDSDVSFDFRRPALPTSGTIEDRPTSSTGLS